MSKPTGNFVSDITDNILPYFDASVCFAIAICGAISWKNFQKERKLKYPPSRENAILVLTLVLVFFSLIQLFKHIDCEKSLSRIVMDKHNFVTIISCLILGILIMLLQKKRKIHVPGLTIYSDLKGKCVGNGKTIIRVPGEPFKTWDILSNENCGEYNIESTWAEISVLTILSSVLGFYVLYHAIRFKY